ncbi:Lrp/AsnC family transcriptional regulator [Candidatus Woesearchaeota archaeon]|nr:Lrp/AsnC family transcriptional regulator [Candidatus Woesearchaeota archaeon]
MKQKEKEIIKHLRKGKRVNISSIARELDLPVSTVSDAIRRIEKRYVLKRSSLLDYPRLGYNANAVVVMKVNPSQKHLILDFLEKQNCVNSIFHVNSGFNFLIELVCKDNLELLNWIEDVKTNFDVEVISFQILKVVEKERFVP